MATKKPSKSSIRDLPPPASAPATTAEEAPSVCEPLPPFVVSLASRTYMMDLEADLRATDTWEGINESLLRVPMIFSRWAMLEVMMNRQAKKKFAEKFRYHRELLINLGNPKPTEATIKAAVETDDEYATVVAVAGQLEAGRKSLNMLMEAVLERARNFRSELEAGMVARRVGGGQRDDAAVNKLYGQE